MPTSITMAFLDPLALDPDTGLAVPLHLLPERHRLLPGGCIQGLLQMLIDLQTNKVIFASNPDAIVPILRSPRPLSCSIRARWVRVACC